MLLSQAGEINRRPPRVFPRREPGCGEAFERADLHVSEPIEKNMMGLKRGRETEKEKGTDRALNVWGYNLYGGVTTLAQRLNLLSNMSVRRSPVK